MCLEETCLHIQMYRSIRLFYWGFQRLKVYLLKLAVVP